MGPMLEAAPGVTPAPSMPSLRARAWKHALWTLQLVDEDFVDYNHLNTSGVVHYAPLLAEVLRPHLRRE